MNDQLAGPPCKSLLDVIASILEDGRPGTSADLKGTLDSISSDNFAAGVGELTECALRRMTTRRAMTAVEDRMAAVASVFRKRTREAAQNT